MDKTMAKNALTFLESFIEQRSTATLQEFKQVLSAINDLKKYFEEEEPKEENKKIPFPGKVPT